MILRSFTGTKAIFESVKSLRADLKSRGMVTVFFGLTID